MDKVIAERKLLCESLATGQRTPLTIRIGTPRWLAKEGYAVCPREYDGLFETYADAIGIDELQALQLASDVDSVLRGLADRYRFFWDSGDEYSEA
jgi:hypothetical protein